MENKEVEVRSDEEVSEILRRAAASVAAADLAKDLQPAAFAKAVDLLAGAPETVPAVHRPQPAPDADDPIQRIAAKLEVDADVAAEFFDVEDGDVKLTIAPSKLEREKKRGAKQIAVLVGAARQAAGVEEWTPAATIRDVADDYGKFDSANFSRAIGELGDYLSFSGTGRSRRLKVRRAGFEHAGTMIRNLHGQE